jgi:hypothetical protein
VNTELEEMWLETAWADKEDYYLGICLEGRRKTAKNLKRAALLTQT